MAKVRIRFSGLRLGVMLLALVTVFAACGSDDDDSSSGGSGDLGSVIVGSKNFPESQLIASMYSQVLTEVGYDVKEKFNLGGTEIILPALRSGDIDVVPEYAATVLETVNNSAGEATSDPAETVAKLNERLAADDIVALTPSPAKDENTFVVTEETAQQYDLETLSDLAPVANELVLGAPPECDTRKYCAVGLRDVYGIEFEEVRPLDFGGPVTVKALNDDDVQVGVMFSSDPTIESEGFVILDDDEDLQGADNVVALVRKDKDTKALRDAIDEVNASLTTEKLIELNKQMNETKEDPEDVAEQFLEDEGLL